MAHLDQLFKQSVGQGTKLSSGSPGPCMGYLSLRDWLHQLCLPPRARLALLWLKDVMERTVKRFNSNARLFRLVRVASLPARPLAAEATRLRGDPALSLSRDETAAGDFTVQTKRKQSERHVYCPRRFRPVKLKLLLLPAGCRETAIRGADRIFASRNTRCSRVCSHFTAAGT
jgi:hypothetical protein